MSLAIIVDTSREHLHKLSLSGRLDTNTAPELEAQVDSMLDGDVEMLAFDLAELEYISSAGLRAIFRAKKAMEKKGGSVCMVHMQPQVAKVFDIVKALPEESMFKSWDEVDTYLDKIQKQMTDKG
jgi:anti-anti-sigma factor